MTRTKLMCAWMLGDGSTAGKAYRGFYVYDNNMWMCASDKESGQVKHTHLGTPPPGIPKDLVRPHALCSLSSIVRPLT